MDEWPTALFTVGCCVAGVNELIGFDLEDEPTFDRSHIRRISACVADFDISKLF
jgi:hypothetical protein